MGVPTEEKFLQLVEELYGSRSPDLHAQKAHIEEALESMRDHAKTSTELDTDAHLEALEELGSAWKSTLQATQIGLQYWDDLDEAQRSVFVELLSGAVESADRTMYLIEHSN